MTQPIRFGILRFERRKVPIHPGGKDVETTPPPSLPARARNSFKDNRHPQFFESEAQRPAVPMLNRLFVALVTERFFIPLEKDT